MVKGKSGDTDLYQRGVRLFKRDKFDIKGSCKILSNFQMNVISEARWPNCLKLTHARYF